MLRETCHATCYMSREMCHVSRVTWLNNKCGDVKQERDISGFLGQRRIYHFTVVGWRDGANGHTLS